MANATPIKTNFTAGEVSPRALGRVDIAKYENGAETLRNFLISPFGGAYRRPGTAYIGPLKDHTEIGRLIPFVFNTAQTYVLEFNDSKIRFYRNQAPIVETAKVISGATKADPGVITATSHGYSNGDEVIISGVVGMTELNGRRFVVANVSTHTFELTDRDTGANIDTSAYTTYVSDGTAERVYQIASPYAFGDLALIKFAQINDIMYLVHPDYRPRQLTRTGHAAWTLTEIAFTGGPWLDVNTTATTLDPSDVTGSVTVTASATTGINDGAGFTSADIGRLIKFHDGSAYKTLRITAVGSTTSVTALVLETMGGHVASANWALGAWGGAAGWPSAITFYEQRAAYACTYEQSQTVWLSVPEEFTNFLGGSDADDALQYTIASRQNNGIQWLVEDKVLLLGTSGGVFSMSSGYQNEALTPTNVTVKLESKFGCTSVQPEKIGTLNYYVQRNSKILRELGYNYQNDSYGAVNITLLSAHITSTGISQMAYQETPDSILWCVLADGTIATLTREVNEQVAGWAKQTTDGTFESICSIPGTGYDEVWVIVKRTINGNTRRYIEVFQNPDFGDQEDAYFVDSGLVFEAEDTVVASVPVDDSSEDQTITSFGDAALNASIKKFGTSSLALDGTGDYLSVAHSTDFNFADQNFTIDAQLRFGSVSADMEIVSHYLTNGDLRGWRIHVDPSAGRLYFEYSTDGTSATNNVFYFPWAPSTGSFYHLEIVRSGSYLRALVDGTQIGTGKYLGTSSIYGANTPLLIGAYNNAGTVGTYFNGYIDELRISNGIARHEAVAGNGLLDSSSYARTITLNGNAALYTSDYAFGDGCISLDGTGDFVSCAGAAEFNFGTGVFMMECFVKFTSVSGTQCLVAIGNPNSGGAGLFLSGGNLLMVRDGTTVVTWLAGVGGRTTFTTGIWYHVFMQRDSQNSYICGAARITDSHGVTQRATVIGAVNVSGAVNGISAGASPSGGDPVSGYVDEIRIKDVIVYPDTTDTPTYEFMEDSDTLFLAHFEKFKTSFTAPASAHSDDSYTKLLCHFNGQTQQVPESAINGFEHLEAKSVAVYVDSARQASRTVTSGGFTLETAGSAGVMGLAYESRIKLLRPEGGSATGSSQGKHKRVANVEVRVNESLDMNVGDDTTQYPVDFREAGYDPPTLDSDDITPLRSGDFEIMMPGGWNKNAQPVIVNSYPTPLEVLCLISQLENED